MEVRHIYNVLLKAYERRDEIVPLLIGAPGIGKTQAVQRLAREKGVKLVSFILSNTIPSEVSGIRMPDKDTKKLEVYDDSRMSSLEDGDILFFDEILEASPMVWSACLTLIQDRTMASGRKLPDVMIVAASNPVKSPSLIPPSVRNRFVTFEVSGDGDSFATYFEDKYGVSVPQTLRRRIQETSTTYNVLTPRTVEKLFLWCRDFEDNLDDKALWNMLSAEAFDSSITYDIWDMAHFKKKMTKMDVVEVIKEIAKEHTSGENAEKIAEAAELMDWKALVELIKQDDEMMEALKGMGDLDNAAKELEVHNVSA